MKFPYGICDFHKIITEDYFYVDRTDRIPFIEEAGDQLLFLRPRRFGKSLLLSMLENYYDIAKADEFDKLFGHLAIGKNPTDRHNQYFVLKWDFSAVSPVGEAEQIQQALYDHINGCINAFAKYYRDALTDEITINPTNALASFQSLVTAVHQTPYRLYLLIDEYDNFANEIMMSSRAMRKQSYEALLYGEGALKAVFKAVKAAAAGRGLDRVFITGVSPVVLSDLTSGYNIAENITLRPEFNDLCGFWESEITDTLKRVVKERDLSSEKAIEALSMMQTFYNGYCFSYSNPVLEKTQVSGAGGLIYNSTLALYFMKAFQRDGQYPRKMLDSNLEMDQEKLAYISQLPYGDQTIPDALNEEHTLSIEELADSFGVKNLVNPEKSNTFVASLLYYLGVLTLGGLTSMGKLILKIPNLVVRKLYVEQIQKILLPDFDKDEALHAAETFFSTGNIQPVCDFVEQRYFKVFDNRDYRWINELTVKTAFVTILFNDLWYIMDSEATGSTSLTTGLERDYADLIMIVRPDKRQYQLLDMLIEFKYVNLPEAKLDGATARQLGVDEIKALMLVQQKFAESKTKLEGYRKVLETTYGDVLRLHTYSVVSLGFDRLVWEEVL